MITKTANQLCIEIADILEAEIRMSRNDIQRKKLSKVLSLVADLEFRIDAWQLENQDNVKMFMEIINGQDEALLKMQ